MVRIAVLGLGSRGKNYGGHLSRNPNVQIVSVCDKFQNKIDKGLVTRSEAATMQENLEKKQQDFLSHRDKVMSELAEEEQVMLNKIQKGLRIDRPLSQQTQSQRREIPKTKHQMMRRGSSQVAVILAGAREA